MFGMGPRAAFLVSILAALLGATALAMSFVRPAPMPTPEAPARVEVPSDDARVEALERELRALSARVSSLERRAAVPAGARAEAPEELTNEIDTLREDIDAVLAYQPLETEAGRERLKTIVRGVQHEVFRERAQQMRAAHEAREDERFATFVEEHGLDSAQTQALRDAMEEERKKLRALFDRDEDDGPPDFAKIRPVLEAAREATVKRAAEVLDPQQLGAFEALRSFGPGPGRRRRSRE